MTGDVGRTDEVTDRLASAFSPGNAGGYRFAASTTPLRRSARNDIVS
jgi:hypothetical protein